MFWIFEKKRQKLWFLIIYSYIALWIESLLLQSQRCVDQLTAPYEVYETYSNPVWETTLPSPIHGQKDKFGMTNKY